MPHDKNGAVLTAGDQVMIPCTVKEVQAEGQFCNVTVTTDEPMPGNVTANCDGKNTIVLNAKQVVKCGLVLLALVLFATAGRAADLGSPIPLEQRLTAVEQRLAAVEQRLGIAPSVAGASPTIAAPVVVHPVGTVGRTADGTEVVCTPNGWQPTAASRSYGISDSPVWPPFATQAPVQPLTTAIGAGGFTTTCGPNGCSIQPAGFSSGGLIRRSLGLFR